MRKRISTSQKLAVWFWHNILERGSENPWTSPAFPRYLSEAAKTIKLDIDLDILKDALMEMKSQGIDVQSIRLPLLWTHYSDGLNWYEWMKKKIETPPPIYEVHAYKAWCKKTGNLDLLRRVPEIYNNAS